MQLSRVSEILSSGNYQVFSKIPAKNPFNNFALKTPDQLFNSIKKPILFNQGIGNSNIFSADSGLQNLQKNALSSAVGEWQAGVTENLGKNSGTRVNQYYKNAGFEAGGKGGWCGFFVAFNYAQSGFKFSPHLASMEKARDFFMYRQYTDRSASKENKLDTLKQQHQGQGSQRQFFLLENSPTIKYLNEHKNTFKNYTDTATVFNHTNLPIRPGDTVLFDTGDSGGHVAMVYSYNPNSGKLVTIEGNTTGECVDGKKHSNSVVTKNYDLTLPAVRARFAGFGRPALGDFQ